MDVTRMLETDHRKVEQLFEQIDAAEGEQRQPLIDELATALRAHMELEERVIYPAIKEIVGDETIQEGVTEHGLARKTLEAMLALAPDEPGFGAALEETKAGIEHHVEEEENEVFPQVREQGQAQLEQLTAPVLRAREELGLPIDAASLQSATKDELQDWAREVDVDGASSMTKEQLAEAVIRKLAA